MVKWSIFPNKTNTSGKEINQEWEYFAVSYLCKHFSREHKDGELYSAAIYKEGKVLRCDENIASMSAIIYDFDNSIGTGNDSRCTASPSVPEDHFDNLDGYTYAYHSTYTNSQDWPKWRLVLPTDRPIEKHEWNAAHSGAMALIGNDSNVDPSCADLSRAYWAPSAPIDKLNIAFSGYQKGNPISVDYLIELSGQIVTNVINLPQRQVTTVPTPKTSSKERSGRNDELKAQVAACLSKGKSLDQTVKEIIEYDSDNHNPPLFSDPTENMRSDAYTNAVKFVSSNLVSINKRRVSQGLLPQLFENKEVINGEIIPFEIPAASIWADQKVKKREWLLDQWIPVGQTTALYGDGGIGKTLLAQQIATCTATGRALFGMPIKQGSVLGVFCEDDQEELHRRQHGILKSMRVSYKDINNLYLLSRIGEDNLLMKFDNDVGSLTEFWHQLNATVEKLRPSLIIVDTAADTFGGNENIRPQVRQYVQQALTHIAVTYHCSVLLCAHPSASGLANGTGTGGSTAWNNSVRSRLYIYKDENTGRVILEKKKSNYSSSGEQIEMIWSNGAFIPCAELPDSLNNTVTQERLIEEDFIVLLDEHNDRNVNVSSNTRGNYAPRVFEKSGRISGMKWTKEQYEFAMERLFKNKKIRLENIRRGQRIIRFQ